MSTWEPRDRMEGFGENDRDDLPPIMDEEAYEHRGDAPFDGHTGVYAYKDPRDELAANDLSAGDIHGIVDPIVRDHMILTSRIEPTSDDLDRLAGTDEGVQ